ncbi:hypothetical protein F1559_002933 [Cyanidiococcus yangmingshanensis]|uniref:Uncharacterized protein n=1 Tax=Cyanidiococcus yangmingshanensis TaxID=2690220 RepID=A0A7J7ILG5_9RHOD|nr:hypothetical protein F1559_002933 [Cyanidiococcus yangmingshanensis]
MSSATSRPQVALGTRGETRRLLREVERAARYGELRRWRKDWVTIGNVRCYAWVPSSEEETRKADDEDMETEGAAGASTDDGASALGRQQPSQLPNEPEIEAQSDALVTDSVSFKVEEAFRARSPADVSDGVMGSDLVDHP